MIEYLIVGILLAMLVMIVIGVGLIKDLYVLISEMDNDNE